MRCGINYVMDGPCGDCPYSSLFTCDAETCIHWLAWIEITDTIMLCYETELIK